MTTSERVELETAEVVEARIRRLMFEHSQIEPRGFDSARRRADLHAQIDAAYDDWDLVR